MSSTVDDAGPPTATTEYLRAIEAIVLVAHDPVPPTCSPSCSNGRSATSRRWCTRLADEYRGRRSRLRARARRRRLPLPDGRRPDRLRRALPAQRPAGPPVRRRPRDAGDRRLQAADLARPDRLDPRRRPRRRAAHAAVAWLRRRRRSRPGARPGRAVRHDRRVPRDASASTPPPTCRRSPSSSPAPTSSRRWKRACARSNRRADAEPDRVNTPPGAAAVASATVSGCRRCSPPPGGAAGGSCEELIAAGRVRVNGEVAVLGRRVDPETDLIEVDGAPVGVRPGLVYYLLNKPARRRHDGPRHARPARPSSSSSRRNHASSRSAASTPTPRACCCSPTTASWPTASPIPSTGVEKEYLAEVEVGARRQRRPGGDPHAARGRRARRRRHGPGQGHPAVARRAADHHPRGPQPPGPADVRGRRPPRPPPRPRAHRSAHRPAPEAGRMARRSTRRRGPPTWPWPRHANRPGRRARRTIARYDRAVGDEAGERHRSRADRRVDRPRPARRAAGTSAATTCRPRRVDDAIGRGCIDGAGIDPPPTSRSSPCPCSPPRTPSSTP